MGNCVSICGGRRKILVLSDFEMVTLSSINEGANHQPQGHSPASTILPIGIALTTNEVIAAPVPAVNAATSNQALGSSQPVGEDPHSLTDSLEDVTTNDTQVQIARPVNYSRPGPQRLVTSTSSFNVRDLREKNDAIPSHLHSSATMGNLDGPLKGHPHDDPVEAYIAKGNMELEKAWKAIAPDKGLLVDFIRERNVARSQILRGSAKITFSNDLPVDGDDNNTELVEEVDGGISTGITQKVSEDNETSRDLICILRQRIWELETEKALLKPIPSPVIDNANDTSNPAIPSPIRSSCSPASAVTDTSNDNGPSTREASIDLSPSDFVGSPHRTGLPRRPRPVGIIGPSTPTRSPGELTGLHYEAHSRDDFDTEAEQPSVVSEAGPSQIIVHDTLPQVPFDDEERDYSLYALALEDATKNYYEAKPIILAKVRRFVASERTILSIGETILAMTDDVVDACINDEDSLELVQMLVTGSCQGSELVPNGKMTPTLREELDREAEATKVRKAIALLEKWAADAKAEEEAKEEAKDKGKGKEKVK